MELSDRRASPSRDKASFGKSEQACNECKRRKIRCDRDLPQCTPCRRNRRHCLYDRYKRTPLTRLYLTELESRLERAEQRVQLAEQRARAAEQGRESTPAPATRPHSAYAPPVDQDAGPELSPPGHFAMPTFPPGRLSSRPASAGQAIASGQHASHSTWVPTDSTPNLRHSDLGPSVAIGSDRSNADPERESQENEAFSWNENEEDEAIASPDGTPAGSSHTVPPPADGMATLAVHDHGHGYLGSPSGAAMLRLLLSRSRSANVPLSLARDRTRAATAATQSTKSPTRDSTTLENIDLDSAINAYFSVYHINYPIVHEPTFRAQFSFIIPRPDETCFNVLVYIVAAIGLLTLSNGSLHKDHARLFSAAKEELKIGFLEKGNLTLVQALALMSNYSQKCNRPNSGWNYLGLALHMALGLGLHREITSVDEAPLHAEIRRRIWWTLHNFYIGAAITFGRPSAWPDHGIEAKFPLNIFDRDLTSSSKHFAAPREAPTTYSLLLMQAKFHQATNPIYYAILSEPLSASRLLQLDKTYIEPWIDHLPQWYREDVLVSEKFRLGQKIMFWRLRNFRLIMYRPFLFDHFYNGNTAQSESHVAVRCLEEAEASIASIHSFWLQGPRNGLAGWYALYFLFQASLVPCAVITLASDERIIERSQKSVDTALSTMNSLQDFNAASESCASTVRRLSGRISALQRGSTDQSGLDVLISAAERDQPDPPGNLGPDTTMQDSAWVELFQSALEGTDHDFHEMLTWSWFPDALNGKFQ